MSKSYTNFSSQSTELLWKLHLRHGHRNFVDLARQYNLAIPKEIPACATCIIAKGHCHPHLQSNFVHAERIGQGFHADFKGPYPISTPLGHNYLLVIIDDYSKKIFAFLVKSQDEWCELWKSFVARIEAELGKQTAISWLLTDYGTVFRSHAMTLFCFQKGIQQLHAAPGAQWMDGTSERTIRTISDMVLSMLGCPSQCGGMLHCTLWKCSIDLLSQPKVIKSKDLQKI
jgi:hypothetical protein